MALALQRINLIFLRYEISLAMCQIEKWVLKFQHKIQSQFLSESRI